MSIELKTGDKAPDFELPGAEGPINLSHFKGRIVVLYFYPKDDTSGCTAEAQGFTAAADDFLAAGAVVMGVSKDSVASHLAVDLHLAAASDAAFELEIGADQRHAFLGPGWRGAGGRSGRVGRPVKARRVRRRRGGGRLRLVEHAGASSLRAVGGAASKPILPAPRAPDSDSYQVKTLTAASTSATWPGTFTLRQMCRITPSRSIR